MKLKILLLFVALVALCIGCGGSGGGSDPNPFAGTWYPEISSGNLQIENNGDFTMNIASSIGGTDRYSGDVTRSGSLSGTMYNTTQSGIVFDVSGTLVRESSSRLNLTITIRYGGNSATVTEDFTSSRSASTKNSEVAERIAAIVSRIGSK